jgi:hypothetical protein
VVEEAATEENRLVVEAAVAVVGEEESRQGVVGEESIQGVTVEERRQEVTAEESKQVEVTEAMAEEAAVMLQ